MVCWMISNLADFEFSINESKEADILRHLKACDRFFEPPLHTYVNIENYTGKIFLHAVRIECWHNNELIGLVAIYLNDVKSGKGYITNVSVLPGYSGRGIAKKLLQLAIAKAAEKQFERVALEVNRQNQKAIGLYEQMGFTTSKYVGMNQFMTRNLISDGK
jgi:ribosomal protein S18 acetylase RimI-like enzyme